MSQFFGQLVLYVSVLNAKPSFAEQTLNASQVYYNRVSKPIIMAFNTTLQRPEKRAADTAMDGLEEIAAKKKKYDMSSTKPFDGDVLNTEIITIQPSTEGWRNHNEIEFKINSTGTHWIDLKETRLHLDFKITTKDKRDIAEDAKNFKCIQTANFVQNLFSKVEMFIGEGKKFVQNLDYGLASTIHRILQNDQDDDRALNVTEYYNTHTNDPNITVPANDDTFNAVPSWRYELIRGSKLVRVQMPINHYFLNQPKPLPPAVTWGLKFQRNPPAKLFNVDTGVTDTPIVTFEKMELKIKRVELESEKTESELHKLTQQNGEAQYPVLRHATTEISVPSGIINFNKCHILNNSLPTRMAIMWRRQETSTFSGNVSFDANYFPDPQIERLLVKFDTKEYPERNGYSYIETDPANEARMKRELYVTSMREWRGGHGKNPSLTYEKWLKYYNIYCFDLSPNKSAYSSTNFEQTKLFGDLSMEVTFKGQLTHALTMVVFAEFQDIVSIDLMSMTPIVSFNSI